MNKTMTEWKNKNYNRFSIILDYTPYNLNGNWMLEYKIDPITGDTNIKSWNGKLSFKQDNSWNFYDYYNMIDLFLKIKTMFKKKIEMKIIDNVICSGEIFIIDWKFDTDAKFIEFQGDGELLITDT